MPMQWGPICRLSTQGSQAELHSEDWVRCMKLGDG